MEQETQNVNDVYESVGASGHLPKITRNSKVAITAFVLGIFSLLGMCCCGINVILAPIAIVCGVVALVQKHDGTGFSIAGIMLSVLSIVMVLAVVFSFRTMIPYSQTILTDYMQLVEEQDTVFPAYEETHTLPAYMNKYLEPPFSDFMDQYDTDVYDFMDVLLEQYKSGLLHTYDFSVPADSSTVDLSDVSAEPAI
ncbi:MAG: hypothetical protein MJ071_05020 [Oscillospiraceae bacterium]|nr:hypothetical protein [Oscillospiraceae bacterium]